MGRTGDTVETGLCVNCGDEVPITAVECTTCGYRIPDGGVVTDLLYLLIGNLLTITVIGAIVGLPLMRRALRRLERRSTESVARQNE